MENEIDQDLLPLEIMIHIILSGHFEAQQLLTISLISTHWYQAARDDYVWIKVFIKDFSYNPIHIREDFSQHTFFDTYKHQLILNQKIKKKCDDTHSCMEGPGLLEAIQEENIPLIYALLASQHKISAPRLFGNIDVGSFADNNALLRHVANIYKPLFSKLSNLPKSLLVQLMKRSLGNEHQVPLEDMFLAYLTFFAKPILLKKVFKILDESLFDLIEWLDFDANSFITSLFEEPEPERLILILNILKETIGESNLSKLLVIRARKEDGLNCDCEIFKAYRKSEDIFSLLLSYLLPQDFKVLLLPIKFFVPEGYLFRIVLTGNINLLSTIWDGWKDNKEEAFEHKDSRGRNILIYAICSGSIRVMSSIRNNTSAEGFYHLLCNKSL